MGRLQGKTALVTGAASGIGLGIAACFAAEGAQVVFTDIDLEACTRASQEHGGAVALELDVALEDGWASTIPRVMDRFGKLDVLVNNAGIALLGDVETLSVADFDRTMAVDLRGVFLGCKYAVKVMKAARQGSIINMSSVSGHQSSGGTGRLQRRQGGCCADDQIRRPALRPAGLWGSLQFHSSGPHPDANFGQASCPVG